MKSKYPQTTLFAMVMSMLLLLNPQKVFTHCDGLDGPVVKAAREALKSGDINPVLIWVKSADEGLIKEAFAKTIEVGKLNLQSRELAEMYFFETLVRVHRAGEGAPYSGLKPAGRDLGPVIPEADRAITDGNLGNLKHLLTQAVEQGLNERFQNVISKKAFPKNDIQAGREFVEAYVSYIHYVEALYEAAVSKAEGHFPEKAASHDEL